MSYPFRSLPVPIPHDKKKLTAVVEILSEKRKELLRRQKARWRVKEGEGETKRNKECVFIK